MSLSLAISPCPNDTFTFHALVHGRVAGAPPVDVTYADVNVTNTAALDGRFDPRLRRRSRVDDLRLFLDDRGARRDLNG